MPGHGGVVLRAETGVVTLDTAAASFLIELGRGDRVDATAANTLAALTHSRTRVLISMRRAWLDRAPIHVILHNLSARQAAKIRTCAPRDKAEPFEHWANGYDWSAHERRISELPWTTVRAGDTDLRVIHRRSADPGAPAVVLLRSWPDSVLRFERVLPLFTDTHVVVPALPGFPFAAPLTTPGMSANRIAEIIADALDQLGYSRYTVSGGDVGGTIAELLAAQNPNRVATLHLTNTAPQHALTADPAKLAPDAAAYLHRSAQWFRTEGGYIAQQSTRPNTLAVALGDSPVGLAAWIVEKLESWSDESGFIPHELLTWVTAYWITGTIGASFTTYAEPVALPDRIDTPTVLSIFPHDIKPEPRSYAEAFLNVREYVEHRAGGHLAAWEQPEAYADDLHRAVKLAG
ncbi:alpha/beta fold hydrolase [Streptomyces malaysiensis]|uniref:alpha/beta fold hydrolase n=1 Tax=Streptomyces malaysiensis TaxID=92644 RepID=UPI002B310DE1|nr:alpha/beta fold hydrolase [Streptomyces malaysiensis]